MTIEPCPFCKLPALENDDPPEVKKGLLRYGCICGARGPWKPSDFEAIRAWNKVARRLDPPAVLAALEEADSMAAVLVKVRELAEARETIKRLNRRAQVAEAGMERERDEALARLANDPVRRVLIAHKGEFGSDFRDEYWAQCGHPTEPWRMLKLCTGKTPDEAARAALAAMEEE